MIKRTAFIFLLFLCLSFPVQAARERNVNIYDVPRDAPQIPFYTSEGQPVVLDDFKGSFVMLLTWSRECSPCINELEGLNTFYKKTKDNGITLLMLSPSHEWKNTEEQRRFLQEYGAPDLPFYTDKESKLTAAFGIYTSPHTVLLNKKGMEIGRIRGAAEWEDPRVIEYMYKLKAEYN